MIIIHEYIDTYSMALDDIPYITAGCLGMVSLLDSDGRFGEIKYFPERYISDVYCYQLAQKYVELNPSYIGLYMDYNNVINYPHAEKLSKYIKELNPEIKVFCFGDNTYLYTYKPLPSSFDFAIIGNYKNNAINILTDPDSLVPGLLVHDREFIVNPEPIERVPYVNSNFFKNYIKIHEKDPLYLFYNVSTGCPNKCAYCFYKLNNDFTEYTSRQNFLEELDIIKGLSNLKCLKFEDRFFNYNKKECKFFLSELSKKIDPSVFVQFEMRAEFIDEEISILLSKFRNCQIGIGLQTFNEDTLHRINRYFDMDLFLNGIGLLSKHKVRYSVDLIFGLPGEGLNDLKNNFNKLFDILYNLNIQNDNLIIPRIEVFALHIPPGTYLFNDREKYNYVLEPPFFKVISSDSITSAEVLLLDSFIDKNQYYKYRSNIDIDIFKNCNKNYFEFINQYF